jgi:hypothetical protein
MVTPLMPRTHPLSRRTWLILGALTAVSVVLRALVLKYVMFGLPSDDAYIFMRYSENIAKGLGPFYNPGDAVMGFTSPLFTYAVAVLRLATPGVSLLTVVTIFNLILFCLSTFLLVQLTVKKSVWGWAPVLGWLFYFPFVVGTVNGMESTLFVFCALGAMVFWERERYDGFLIWLAFGMLARPEGILLWIMGAWLMVVKRPKSIPWVGAGVAGLLLGGWLVVAVQTFGSPLPESMVAKSIAMSRVGGASRAGPALVVATQVLGAGSNSVRGAGRTEWLLEAVSLVGLGVWAYGLVVAIRRRAMESGLILLFGLLVVFYIAGRPVTISTWYTVIPCLCFWFSMGYVAEIRLPVRWVRPVLGIVGLFVVASIFVGARIQKVGHNGFTGVVARLANHLNRAYPQARSIMISDIGIVGYRTGAKIIDLDGLVSRSTMKLVGGRLISFGELAQELKPDIVSYPVSIDFVGTVTDGTVSRTTFNSEKERLEFLRDYQPTPHNPAWRDFIYVRRDLLSGRADGSSE